MLKARGFLRIPCDFSQSIHMCRSALSVFSLGSQLWAFGVLNTQLKMKVPSQLILFSVASHQQRESPAICIRKPHPIP